ncbi:hypothetical protein Q3G72_016566 [Acer saccharum]|nr:hypothetical protein Q3G72_016566 [Acer saccharum]
MEPIATVAAADPEAPPHTIQLPEIEESASSSQGPRNQDNAPIYNWPTLDLIPSKNRKMEASSAVDPENPAMDKSVSSSLQASQNHRTLLRKAAENGDRKEATNDEAFRVIFLAINLADF